MAQLRFSLALTICESWALFLVSSWCVNLIRVFLHDDTLHLLEGFHASWTFLVLQQQQNLERKFGTCKMHLSPRWLRLLSVLRRWFCCWWLFVFVYCNSIVGAVFVLCFVVRNFISILVLQSSWWGRESRLLCLICLLGVSWWLSGSSSRCHGVVCSLRLWYFLIILTYFFFLWLFLTASWVVLQYVIAVFPDHSHLLLDPRLIRPWAGYRPPSPPP